jgi:hypothetical protein
MREQQARAEDGRHRRLRRAAAQARSRALEAAAANERDRAVQARAQEAAAAERIKAAEAEIVAAEARIAIVDRLLAAQRVQVAERQGPIVRLIAALQSMARRPPVLGLVQPGSTEDMVHVRAVLGTTMPVVERRTAEVRAELARVQRLRANAAGAVKSLRDSRARLESRANRAWSSSRPPIACAIAAARAQRPARIGPRAGARRTRTRHRRPDAVGGRGRQVQRDFSLEPPGTVAPRPEPTAACAAAAIRHAAPYRLPGLGPDRHRAWASYPPPACAHAASPIATAASMRGWSRLAAGRIVYAGPFRGYGGVVIIDHGDGWTSLIAGLGGLAVRVGDQVSQGQVIGRAWAKRRAARHRRAAPAGPADGPRAIAPELTGRGNRRYLLH